MLTRQAVEEFREIYRRRYGVSLSETDALEMASGLLNLYRSVYAEPNMKRTMKNDRAERTDQKQ
jgi:hypothetical protein